MRDNLLELIRIVLKAHLYLVQDDTEYHTSGTRTRLWFIMDNTVLKGEKPIDYIIRGDKLNIRRLKKLDKLIDEAILEVDE
jgi:hypothetical protein